MTDLDTVQRIVGNWAERTFPQATPDSILNHLFREVTELAAAVHLGPPEAEEKEAADCLLLLLHLAHRRGFSLMGATLDKFAEDQLRRWGKPDAAGVVSHIREQAAAASGDRAAREETPA